MYDSKQLTENFLKALMSADAAPYEPLMDEDATLLFERWNGMEIHRSRGRVIQSLIKERLAWPDPTVEIFTIIAESDLVAVEFRIQATERERYIEHNRSAFLRIREGRIQRIILYCPEPIPSSRRKGWIAPTTLTEKELSQVFETLSRGGDVRERVDPNFSSYFSLRGGMGGIGAAHPASNSVGFTRWTSEDADQKIEEIIAFHRERNIGFHWFVSPLDTPADLKERLEYHGLILAGDVATMARLGLENLDIPTNPEITMEILDGSDQSAINTMAHITQVGFNLPPEEEDEMKLSMAERMQDVRFRERETNFLAYLEGQPVGNAQLLFQGGVAYMGGATTLPEFRGQKVYSTLLRRRLEQAHSRGYQVAAINAEPMSRRIVSRYGFKEYARIYIFGWMPVTDIGVIKSLVSQ